MSGGITRKLITEKNNKTIIRCIGSKWPKDQLADGHLGPGLNGQWPFGEA